MRTPTKTLSYRRCPLGREQSGVESGSRLTVPVSLGRPPSLHGLRRLARRASQVILPNKLRSRIFSLGRTLAFLCSPASQVLRGRVTSPSRTSTACALRLPVAAQAATAAGQPVDLPIPAHGVWGRALVLRPRGVPVRLARGGGEGMLPSSVLYRVGTPECLFRGSIARPALPPTSNASAISLRRSPHDGGRSGSLLLLRERLSLFTPCRF